MKIKSQLVIILSVLFVTNSLFASSQQNQKSKRQQAIPFQGCDVKLLDGPFKTARDRAAKTLLDEYEPDKFLAWIRPMAGLEPKAEKYQGWESWVTTHSLGHYMSGLARAYDQTGNPELKKTLRLHD